LRDRGPGALLLAGVSDDARAAGLPAFDFLRGA
jgi:hypothetical protein